MPILSYRDLEVWKKAMDAAALCYAATKSLPIEERYGLTSQMRRAVVSVASNIAEGHGARLPKRYAYHLAVARGSLMELETQVLLAERLGYLADVGPLLAVCDEVSRMLSTLRRRLD